MLFDIRKLRLVDENRGVADRAEIDHGGKARRRPDRHVATRPKIGQRANRKDAADAEAAEVDLVLTGNPLDDVDGLQRSLAQIMLEALIGVALAWVHPGNHEHRVTLIDQPAEQDCSRAVDRGCSTC